MPKQVDHEQRRQELTGHVWALIRKGGLDAVTVRALSEQSGWSSGAIRHYLPTRERMLGFAAERLSEEVEAHLRGLELSSQPLAAFEQFLLALLPLDEPSREWLEVWLAFASAAIRGEDYADTHGILYRDLQALILDILRDFAAKGWLRDPDADPIALAAELHALVDGLALHLLLRQLEPEQATASVRRAIRRILAEPS